MKKKKKKKIRMLRVFRIWKDEEFFLSLKPPQEGGVLLNLDDGYFKCPKCEDYIHWNTARKLILCRCRSMAVQGCMRFTTIIGQSIPVFPQKN